MDKAMIVMDSFKGSLSSLDAGRAAREALLECGWRAEDIICLPVSDGGKGFVEVMSCYQQDVKKMTAVCHDPLMRPVKASYILCNEFQRTAYIESASVLGSHLISDSERNAMEMTSYGLGELIRHAADHGARIFRIGLGGTAVCDGGLGMLQALGVRLYYGRRMPIYQSGPMFHLGVNLLDASSLACTDMNFTCWCDTSAPFCGENGAVRSQGAAKGIPASSMDMMDKWMAETAKAIQRNTGVNVATMPYSGAAGGVAGALAAFLDAALVSGSDSVTDQTGLSGYLRDGSLALVITGEGRLDAHTAPGRITYDLAAACRMLRTARSSSRPQVICLSGMVDPGCGDPFDRVVAVTPPELIHDGRPCVEAMRPEAAAANIRAALKAYLTSEASV